MKPARFDYHRPESVAEALAILSAHENAKVIAGGQSLVPMMNFRFVQPSHLVDINRVAGLDGLVVDAGRLRAGAMVRQRRLERSPEIARCFPILAEALRHVGHLQTRNRGTLGGSLCHLDPAAELPTIALVLDADIHVASPQGMRRVPMSEFIDGFMTPGIGQEEIVAEVELRWPEGNVGWGFEEFARRPGDFALASAAAVIAADAEGRITHAAIAVGGVGPVAQRCGAAETLLVGSRMSEELAREAARACTRIEAVGDVHASPAYRLHLTETLAGRALRAAADRLFAAGG